MFWQYSSQECFLAVLMADLFFFKQSLNGCQYLCLQQMLKTSLIIFLRLDRCSFHHVGIVFSLYLPGHKTLQGSFEWLFRSPGLWLQLVCLDKIANLRTSDFILDNFSTLTVPFSVFRAILRTFSQLTQFFELETYKVGVLDLLRTSRIVLIIKSKRDLLLSLISKLSQSIYLAMALHPINSLAFAALVDVRCCSFSGGADRSWAM